jgi:transcription elongation factor GreA
MREALITHEGLTRLRQELEDLAGAGRREIIDRIRHSMSTDANVAENADYHGARDEQALLERRIAILQERIASAQVAEPDASNGTVDVGERVRLRDLDSGEKVEYVLVGSLECDPLAGRISVASPVGEALLGRRCGDVAIVAAPKGRFRFKILAIEMPVSADAALVS